jgi:hypothetical protein
MDQETSKDQSATQEKSAKPDRRLGDEWADWNGDDAPAVLDEDRRVFIGFAFLCLVGLIALLGVTFYMIYPRLEGWHEYLARGVMVLLGAFSLAVVLWFAAIALPLLTGIKLPWRMEFVQRSLHPLIPFTIRVGRWFGINRDRMGNSFIKVSNALVRGARINMDSGPLLVLLPRCLAPNVRKQIQALGERYKCLVHVVPGGELARKLIRDHNPSRIIAVACERDLVSGIQDVAPIIPTFAVPNCRPEGPCKNTLVDMDRMEEAMILFSPRASA